MTRLTETDRERLLSQLVVLRAKSVPAAGPLFRWAKANWKGCLSRCPTRPTCYAIERKLLQKKSITAALKDLPRSQARRTGKRALLSAATKRAIVYKAKDKRRASWRRRSCALAQETHAGRRVTATTIRRTLRAAGLVFRRLKKKPLWQPHHISIRKQWAEKWVAAPTSFWETILFSDEKIFRLARNPHKMNDGLWVTAEQAADPQDQTLYISTPYDSVRVNVWGAAAHCGKTELCIIRGSNDEQFYTKTIIHKHVLPFFKAHKTVKIFQQDGCGVHTSQHVQSYLDRYLGKEKWTKPPPPPCKEADNNGKIVKSKVVVCKNGQVRHYSTPAHECSCTIPEEYFHPALSPDMAIAENFWAWMERWLNQQPPVTNRVAFEQLLLQAWSEMPLEFVQKLVAHYPQRIQTLVDAQGQGTKF